MSRKVWYSRIDFRPNPIDPTKDVINLGFLLEFTTEDYWVIGMILRAALEDAVSANIDELSRKLIEHREEVIKKELRRILPRANKPGEALSLLSAANPWSIHITPPDRLEIPDNAPNSLSVEKIAEKYALSLFMRDRIPARKSKPLAQRRVASSNEQISGAAQAPAPWLLTPTCVMRPLMHA